MSNKGIDNLHIFSHNTKAELIYNTLRSAILHKELMSGDRLNTSQLARKFSVSLGPVREALRTLYEKGLIDYSPHRGYVVYDLSPDETKEIFLIISTLSGLVAKLAFENINDEIIDNLDQLLTQAEDCVVRGDLDSWNDLTFQFHNLIVKCADSELLTETINHLKERSFLITRDRSALKKRIPEANKEHRQILNSLRSRSKDEFIKLLEKDELDTAETYVDAAKKARVRKSNKAMK